MKYKNTEDVLKAILEWHKGGCKNVLLLELLNPELNTPHNFRRIFGSLLMALYLNKDAMVDLSVVLDDEFCDEVLGLNDNPCLIQTKKPSCFSNYFKERVFNETGVSRLLLELELYKNSFNLLAFFVSFERVRGLKILYNHVKMNKYFNDLWRYISFENESIKVLDLSNTNLTPIQFHELSVFKTNFITHLNLSHTSLDFSFPGIVSGFFNRVQQNRNLLYLNLSGMNFTDEHVNKWLVPLIDNNVSLLKLDLSNNPGITLAGWEQLEAAVKDRTSLRLVVDYSKPRVANAILKGPYGWCSVLGKSNLTHELDLTDVLVLSELTISLDIAPPPSILAFRTGIN
jgi:hypothetical protein